MEYDPADLTCQMAESFDVLEDLRSEWDAAAERLGAPVYMTYDWLRTWWQFYGRGKQLRLFLFRNQGRLVALFPFYIEVFGRGPLRTRAARLVGANVPPKAFDPPVDEAVASAVLNQVLQHLLGEAGCDLVSLGPVSRRWSGQDAWPADGSMTPPAWCARQPCGTQTLFPLPATWESYLDSLETGERKSRLKRIRRLERQFAVEADVVAYPEPMLLEFDRFAALHARQWQAVGKGGHFKAWPEADAYNRELTDRQASQGRARFYRLKVNGEVVASRYAFQFGDTLFSELPARVVGEPWDKLGIGVISLMKFNEAVIRDGISKVDSGLGSYTHKVQLGGEEVPVETWRFGRTDWRARGRTQWLLGLAAVVRVLYHKVWCRRVLPRLPRAWSRTQSLSWLRFDL